MKQQIEDIIKKNLPKKVDERRVVTFGEWQAETYGDKMLVNAVLDQINISLIADEVLKVVMEFARNWAKERREMIDNHEYCKNEGERWENGYDCAMYDILQELNTLSPNKENQN